MKRLLALVLMIIFSYSIVNAQNCPVPNASFESHYTLNLGIDSIEVPMNFNPYVSLIFSILAGGVPGVDTTHDAYSGNLALKLYKDTLNNALFGGDVLSVIPCNNYVSLNGYYKLENPALTDSALVGLTGTRYNTSTQKRDTIFDQGIRLGATSTYTPFTFTPNLSGITTPIDTLTILALYFPQNDLSSLKLDSISLQSITVGIENEGDQKENFFIYPNPSEGELVIKTKNLIGEIIQISNITGTVFQEIKISSNQELIDLSELPKGLYFLKANGQTRKIVLNK